MTENCFKKCTSKSGLGIDRREQNCLALCTDRYMETVGVVSEALVEHQQAKR
jgi:import inner membrane translocase subunit TIM13